LISLTCVTAIKVWGYVVEDSKGDPVVVLSPQYFVRLGFSQLLSTTSQTVHECTTVEDLKHLCESIPFGTVVIVEWDGFDEKAIALLGSIAKKKGVRYIFHGAESNFCKSYGEEIGSIRGYISHEIQPEIIQATIRLVQEDYLVLPPRAILSRQQHNSAVNTQISHLDRGDLDSRINSLSIRETEVLMLIGEGLGSKRIAHLLEISDSTVRLHTRAVIQKLGLENRTQAALVSVNIKQRPRPST